MRTSTFKAATMSVTATVQISTCTWVAATPFEWKEAPGPCTKGPTSRATCTSYLGASTPSTSTGWASTTASAPAELFTWWVQGPSDPAPSLARSPAPALCLFPLLPPSFFFLLLCETIFLTFSYPLMGCFLLSAAEAYIKPKVSSSQDWIHELFPEHSLYLLSTLRH